jgi:sulfate permease, SulP family
MLLLLFAESYSSIRTLALKHGDAVSPNRDLAALGLANLLSGLLQGTPVGAGYSASSANEAAGAASRLAGVIAAVTVTVLMASVLPLVALTPEPVLAAVVVHALAHALSLDGFRPYFGWRRDRLVVVAAALAVLVFGVLDGLLAAIAISLAATLRTLSYPVVNELGRLGNSPDFLSMASHAEVRRVTGLLVLRPEAALFFANIEGVLAAVRRRVDAASPRSLVLSLEETPDLDGTSVEALQDFVGELSARGVRVMLARVSTGRPLGEDALECGSVDDAVRRLSC